MMRILLPLLPVLAVGCGTPTAPIPIEKTLNATFTVAESPNGTVVTAAFNDASTGQPYFPNPPWPVTVNGVGLEEVNGNSSQLFLEMGDGAWSQPAFAFAVPAVMEASGTIASVGHCVALEPADGALVDAAAGFAVACLNSVTSAAPSGIALDSVSSTNKTTVEGPCIDPFEFDGAGGNVPPNTLHVTQPGGCVLTVTIARTTSGKTPFEDSVFASTLLTTSDIFIGHLNLSP